MKRNLYPLIVCMFAFAFSQKAFAQIEVQSKTISVVKVTGLKDPVRKQHSFVPLAKGVQTIYANLSFEAGAVVSNGGASSATQGTRILADDINFAGTAPFKINQVSFSVTNSDAVSFTARPRIRFWKNDGTAGGPGTLVAAYSFSVVPFAPLSATTLSASLGSGFTFPDNAAWVGIFFDAPAGATASVDNLNNLGQAAYDPPTMGTSADQYFLSTNAGSATNNPNGSIQGFGVGGPPVSANFGWTFQQSCDNEPTGFNITGGGLYCGTTGVAIGLDGSESGVSYQLMNESTMVGTPVAGTGSAISFGDQTVEGIYSVEATSAGGCSATMQGIAVVNVGTPSSSDTTATACDSLVWQGSTYYTSGNYDFHTTNASGCDSTITLHLTINTSPTITSVTATNNPLCIGGRTDLTANGVSGTNAVVNWFSGPGGTGTNLGSGPTLLNVGVGTYYARVTGDCGSPAEQSLDVVIDNIKPDIVCPANRNESSVRFCYRTLEIDDPVYSDNCTVTSLTWEMTGATIKSSFPSGIQLVGMKAFEAGTTTVTYLITDRSGNTNTCSFDVTITDLTRPKFTSVNSNIQENVVSGCTKDITLPDITFTDNCGTPTLTWVMTGATVANGTGLIGTYTFNLGVTTIAYTITDGNNNSRTSLLRVTLSDRLAPTITCPANITTNTNAGACTKNIGTPQPVFGDNCKVGSVTWTMSGATTAASPLNGFWYVNTKLFNAGLTTITYNIKDSSGNTNSCSYTVQLNSTGNCFSGGVATVANKNPFENEVIDAVLKAKLSPNPTKTSFLLQVQSDKKDVVEINVYNRDGKRIQTMKGLPYQMLNIGANYTNGLYMFEILQGERRTTVTGVKQ